MTMLAGTPVLLQLALVNRPPKMWIRVLEIWIASESTLFTWPKWKAPPQRSVKFLSLLVSTSTFGRNRVSPLRKIEPWIIIEVLARRVPSVGFLYSLIWTWLTAIPSWQNCLLWDKMCR